MSPLLDKLTERDLARRADARTHQRDHDARVVADIVVTGIWTAFAGIVGLGLVLVWWAVWGIR